MSYRGGGNEKDPLDGDLEVDGESGRIAGFNEEIKSMLVNQLCLISHDSLMVQNAFLTSKYGHREIAGSKRGR